MSTASGKHPPAHSELVFLYAVQALPPKEAAFVEEQFSACADCRTELESLRRLLDSFVSWPSDLLPASASVSLWERLTQRISAETGKHPLLPPPPQWVEPEWKEVAPGISCKLLATDTEKNVVSMLVKLAPGTNYPSHRHHGVEELHLLEGELIVDDRTFYPGDYRRAEPDSIDHRVWSETGCMCVLVTSFRDAIL